jgi:hypothetical protein
MKKIRDIGNVLTREQQKGMKESEEDFCTFRYCGDGAGYCIPLAEYCVCTADEPVNSCSSD